MSAWWQGFVTGAMTALIPSMLVLVVLLWRAPTSND